MRLDMNTYDEVKTFLELGMVDPFNKKEDREWV